MSDPTVSCVPVAIKDPELLVVTIELAAPVKLDPEIVQSVTEVPPLSAQTTPAPVKLSVVLCVKPEPEF